jgi:hypothetical protein
MASCFSSRYCLGINLTGTDNGTLNTYPKLEAFLKEVSHLRWVSISLTNDGGKCASIILWQTIDIICWVQPQYLWRGENCIHQSSGDFPFPWFVFKFLDCFLMLLCSSIRSENQIGNNHIIFQTISGFKIYIRKMFCSVMPLWPLKRLAKT